LQGLLHLWLKVEQKMTEMHVSEFFLICSRQIAFTHRTAPDAMDWQVFCGMVCLVSKMRHFQLKVAHQTTGMHGSIIFYL